MTRETVTHEWRVYADDWHARLPVWAERREDVEQWGARHFGVPAERVVVRYVKTIRRTVSREKGSAA